MFAFEFLVMQSAGNCSEWSENTSGCFFLKCINFLLNAEEIFTCAPLLLLQYSSLSYINPDSTKTFPALCKRTECYTGDARH